MNVVLVGVNVSIIDDVKKKKERISYNLDCDPK